MQALRLAMLKKSKMIQSIRAKLSRPTLQLGQCVKREQALMSMFSSGSKRFHSEKFKGKNYKDAIEDLTSNYGVSEDQIDIQHVRRR